MPKKLLSDAELRDMIRYYAYCQSLRDFIDEKVIATNFHYQKIKQYTNLLVCELEKQVDVLMKVESGETNGAVLEQFISASMQADYLFDVALKMETIERDAKIECATRISDILKEYGIE